MNTNLKSLHQLARAHRLEVFHVSRAEAARNAERGDDPAAAGWHWWSCSPGCLPDSDAFGPFDSERAALMDALDGLVDADGTTDGSDGATLAFVCSRRDRRAARAARRAP